LLAFERLKLPTLTDREAEGTMSADVPTRCSCPPSPALHPRNDHSAL
jgi:hypothetical protein